MNTPLRLMYVAAIGTMIMPVACGQAAPPASPTAAPPTAVPAAVSAPTPSSKTASGAPPTPRPDWQAEWDRVVAAAKQEGQVTVATVSGGSPQAIFDVFTTKYGIPVNVIGESAGTLLPKVKAERAAGQFLEDVSLNSTNTTINGYKTIDALDPLPPVLILPEALDDKNWIGGFAEGWADTGMDLDYSTLRLAEPVVHVNRQVIPESQLSHIEQLWDPAWKGKIVMGDTRTPTTGTPMLASWIQLFGEDKVRQFVQTQQPVVMNQPRQEAEAVIRGQYPIGFGVGVPDMTYLASQGLDTSFVQPLAPDEPGGVVADDGTGSVALFNRAPHPNAARLLINWLFSQEGQVTISKQTGYNSRRTDVPPVSPSTVVDPNKKYPRIQTEATYPLFLRTMELSKEILQ